MEDKKQIRLGSFKIDQIYCGDTLELIKGIPHATIDLVITDPPFAIDFRANRSNYNRAQERVLEGYNEVPEEKYYDFTLTWIKEALLIWKYQFGVFTKKEVCNKPLSHLILRQKHSATILSLGFGKTL